MERKKELCYVTLYLCVTWNDQGRAFFFFPLMELSISATEKKQVYHVCRDGKKWRENHD